MTLLDLHQIGFSDSGYFTTLKLNKELAVRYYSRGVFHPHQIDFEKFDLYCGGQIQKLKISSFEELKMFLTFFDSG